MKPVRIKRRWKVLAAGVLALTCIVVLFNIWFIQNTNAIIESLVSTQSGGGVQLKLSRSKFRYLSKKLELYNAVFYSAVDSGTTATYQFRVPRLDLKLRSLWAFLAYRELLIDSINLRTPEAIVTLIGKQAKQEAERVSIPEEVGRIYNSILDALQVLQVKRFQIEGGSFSLVNKTAAQPSITTISNIHFHINNLNIRADSAAAEKFLYSDNMVLRVNDQDIMLPDGIHHISFKNLLINVRNKQVQLDSCWVKAETQNDRNAFRIFFDVLKMTNLDFNALYKKNLIKADSVYVNNPDIELALDLKRKRENGKRLELDTIIQQFTGDLALGYIGVQNATVNIVANRGDTTTTFRSKNDNFTMYGLRVNSDSVTPVHVDEFAMILRKYETYSRDSSAVYRFDSLRFTNNKVRLSNFTIQSIPNRSNKASLYYSIPAFELTGLSWEYLLFDRYISADRAVLLNPDIRYSIATAPRQKQKASLFKVLSGLNETIDLDQVEIRNGNLNIQLPGGKKLNLQHVDLVLASNKLLASTSYTGMQQAVDELKFRNAVFTTGNLRAELINLQYSDRLHADELRVTNGNNTLVAQAEGITLNDLVWNNAEKSVFVDQLAWRQANITLKAGSEKAAGGLNAIVRLSNLAGKNTSLTLYANDKVIKTKLERIALKSLEKKDAVPGVLNGLVADGSALEVKAPAFGLKSGAYHIVDNSGSYIRDLHFSRQSLKDTISLLIPQTFFNTQINELLNGTLRFEKLTATAPVLNITANTAAASRLYEPKPKAVLPLFSVAELTLYNPLVNFIKRDSVVTTITWSEAGASSKNNQWTFSNVHTVPREGLLAAAAAEITGNKLLFIRNDKLFGIDSGFVRVGVKNIRVRTRDSVQWKAQLQEAFFQNPISLALKQNGGIGMNRAYMRNVQLSSENVGNVYQLLQDNPAMQLRIVNGSYATGQAQLQWQNMLYSQRDQSLSIDSFRYQPTLDRDSFLAKAPGQVDYMQALLKKVTVNGIDLMALEQDSVFAARSVIVDAPELDLYRDKRKPLISGKLRPLPVLALQSIPVNIMVDTVALKNATITYTEMSDKTGQEGTLTINRMNAQLFPVRNFNVGTYDSLSLRAEGYLMDSAWLRLRLKESYTDSLGTFAMTLRVKPVDLCVLNPILIPMASVKIASGNLDTITMRAIGHEYFSIGEMQMYYRNLKVQFLKKGSETKKTFLTGLITFAANKFVIKKENSRRTGTVYFLRNRDRSIFNFLIKTALSGIASSVGAKRNKKYHRQYKRQQKLYNLPPVDFS